MPSFKSIYRATHGFLCGVALGALDRAAAFGQRAASRCGSRDLAMALYEIRVKWRKGFELAICTAGEVRLRQSIEVVLGFYREKGISLDPDLHAKLFRKLVCLLVNDLSFAAQMAELQKLPIGRAAVRRRLWALDGAVAEYLGILAHKEIKEISGSSGPRGAY